MKYQALFTPIRLGTLTVKNRIAMMAMHHLYTENGLPTERFLQYYYKRAEGGAGLIIVGSCRFDDYGSKEHTMSLQHDAQIAPWKVFTDGMHARGAAVAVQLYHAGRYMPKKDSPAGRALSPSPTFCGYTREQADEITKEEIDEVISHWAAAAVRAKKAGFDAVEISGSVGYLISQFLSPLTNLRTDEYGGDWENRCRFPLRVIEAVREAVGPAYPVFLRMSGSDLMDGSLGEDDLIDFARKAEAAGVDAIDVTGGWHETTVPQLPPDDPQGGLMFLAQGIRDAVSIPVMGGMRVNRPEAAEELLLTGMCDVVTIGRPLIADPDLPRKAEAGGEACIRTCVACNQGCLARTFFDRPVECLVNGLAGREYALDADKPAESPKKILVVGGGPAGCEAAIRLAHRGHAVTLCERSHSLGGLLSLAQNVPTRYEFTNLIAYYRAALMNEGVSVLLGCEVTADSAQGFDAVVLAAGAVREVPPVETDGSARVLTGAEVLSGQAAAGRNVIVLGGDFIGCETARYLARGASLSPDQLYFMTVNRVTAPEKIASMLHSSRRTVSIVEAGPKTGMGYERGTSWPTLNELKRLGVKHRKSTQLLRAENGEAVLQTPDGEVRIPCDTVVVNERRIPKAPLKEQLEALGIPVYPVGDCVHASTALYAIRDAAKLGCTL